MEDDTDVNTLEKRWQAVLDHLNEDEKKWAAMHLHERHNTDTFRITSGIMSFGHKSTLNDSAEANRRREKFQSRYGTNDPPYLDDDDEVTRAFLHSIDHATASRLGRSRTIGHR